MPVYFYVMGLLFYVMGCLMALAASLVLAILPPTRIAAAWIAGGTVGSAVGIFVFQVLSIPFLIVFGVIFWLASLPIKAPGGTADSIWNGALILTFLGIFTVSTATGFFVGWRTGADVATGLSLKSALSKSRLLKRLLRLEATTSPPIPPPP